MKELSIDIETYSSEDLLKTGVYRYAEAPDFTILLFAYAFDDEDIQIVDLASGEALPEKITEALTNPKIIKTAYNANFERTCIAAYLKMPMPPEQWRCSAVAAAELGLPQTLAGVAEALGLQEQKDARGKALINYFSKPCKPTKVNGGRTRNLPQHDSEKWAVFKEYCVQDVAVERAIKKKISRFPMAESEQRLWEVDQHILDCGVAADSLLAQNAILYNKAHKESCKEQLQRLTGIANVNSVAQLKRWIEERTGEVVPSLDKKNLKAILTTTKDEILKNVLRLRAETAKTSVAKYEAVERSVCKDGRVRGILQFYGANRTGRWAGRILQVQNLPQNHLQDLDLARELVRGGEYDIFRMLFPVPQTLSELIRTVLIPSDGCRFIVSDFSAIEARVIAYLADEAWRLNVFAEGGDIYCASASQMFHVPVVKHGINGHLRQKGKVAELACGYGGSVGAMKAMGGAEMSDAELKQLVTDWRTASPHIVQLWWDVERAALTAVREQLSTETHGFRFSYEAGILFIRLLSGRRLAYVKPRIEPNRFGGDSITYEGIGTNRKWERLETYSGKLVENIVQATARDLLFYAMKNLSRYFMVGHVHDEIILECPKDTKLEEICQQMARTPDWANGLLLRADGYECNFYKKD